ncbi:MAG: Tim44/TimA family putative adaptor protein, partial [Gammaproteobacteria bacterium]|nr:Tim44/TimA family putative adaptor protein [Gammaproteobacteria bacterium]
MPLDIVLFAIIAVFLIYRLRSVLGTRHGAERDYPNPFSDKAEKGSSDKMDTSLADAKASVENAKERVVVSMDEKASVSDKASVQKGLIEIANMDENFNVQEFITGAKGAFALIVGAYASGDKETLKPLLSSPLYDDFENGIKAREKAKQTLTMELHN